MHTHLHMYRHIRMYIHTCIHTHLHICTHIRTYTHAYTHTHAHTHTRTNTHTHTRTRARTHTHTHTSFPYLVQDGQGKNGQRGVRHIVERDIALLVDSLQSKGHEQGQGTHMPAAITTWLSYVLRWNVIHNYISTQCALPHQTQVKRTKHTCPVNPQKRAKRNWAKVKAKFL